MITSLNNLTQFIALLILPLTILILSTKIKFYFNDSVAKRNKKINNSEANNLTLEKLTIIIFQFIILFLNQKTNLITNVAFGLILPLHIIICFSFLIKSNEKIKIWNNLFNIKFIILITIIASQLLFVSWQFQNIVFSSNNHFIWIIMFYSTFCFMSFKVGNQALLITKYLILNSYRILICKQNDNFYFNQKKIFNLYSKTEAITTLWNFENLKNTKEMNLTNPNEKSQKIVKNNWILFLIGCNNLLCKNIIKTQKIFINGWKISITE
ncbi:hypothetical protein [Spiroplasma platyhelix]|uniref:Transmembrane protein n=1 Tax=Spiroplasma platyhelix PALS-1 TaxID=1276218 RepID=A0A846U0F1_9MOLU|nr:hypothetical protein [Spiroplasma platyhelix]MBE4703943.1 hypothetical protein [Spiroplasma platyhelix PALS-1]NKE38316.1 hypothetical protein [Spiroplasma platyhelix PALS-1]UJB29201.1 hypothetical protein SPLAT_v1c04370 [Spiroplasma platyhelix PALS-1]